jgi:hypothetical protein
VAAALGEVRTPDIGGSGSTTEFTAAVHRNLGSPSWPEAEEEPSFDWAV